MSKLTISDVAKRVNVSKSTVSQFLNNRFEYMSAETKEKIERAITELGFRPNILARGLKQKKSRTIGIIVPNVLYSFSPQVSRAIEDSCYKNGYHVIVCNSDDDPDKERDYIEMLIDKQVDGLIVLPTGNNQEFFQEMELKKCPLVLLGRKIANINTDLVVLDNVKAAYAATKYFVDKGHRRIAFIALPLANQSPRIERLEGYKKALLDNRIPIIKDYIKNVPLPTIKHHVEFMRNLSNPPTACLLGNDFVLREIMDCVKTHKIRVPEQLSIIVFDQSPYVNFFNPTISTVSQPTYEMGRKAADILLNRISNINIDELDPTEYIFEGKLEIRES